MCETKVRIITENAVSLNKGKTHPDLIARRSKILEILRLR